MANESGPTTVTTEISTGTDQSLEDLAREIRGQHDNCRKSICTSLENARHAGRALIVAKSIVKDNPGSWTRWLRIYCNLSVRQAQRYVQVADGYSTIEPKKFDSAASITENALRLLARLRENYGFAESGMSGEKIRCADESAERTFVKAEFGFLIRQTRALAENLARFEGCPEDLEAIDIAMAVVDGLSRCLDLASEYFKELLAAFGPETESATFAAAQNNPACPVIISDEDSDKAIGSGTMAIPATAKRTDNGQHQRNGIQNSNRRKVPRKAHK